MLAIARKMFCLAHTSSACSKIHASKVLAIFPDNDVRPSFVCLRGVTLMYADHIGSDIWNLISLHDQLDQHRYHSSSMSYLPVLAWLLCFFVIT